MQVGKILPDQLVGQNCIGTDSGLRLTVEQAGASRFVPQDALHRGAAFVVPGAALAGEVLVVHLFRHAFYYSQRGQPVAGNVDGRSGHLLPLVVILVVSANIELAIAVTIHGEHEFHLGLHRGINPFRIVSSPVTCQ